MCLITEHARLLQENQRLNALISGMESQAGQLPPMPPMPRSVKKITGTELNALLVKYGITLAGGSGDAEYLLMAKSEGQAFLDWYRDANPYTADDYDCEDFAWVMRAEAIKWMKGKYQWGYIEAEGIDEVFYNFPNHGFCFVVFDDLSVWFCDELALAAPMDYFTEAYKIKCHMAKA